MRHLPLFEPGGVVCEGGAGALHISIALFFRKRDAEPENETCQSQL
jgi:hypothetical protein